MNGPLADTIRKLVQEGEMIASEGNTSILDRWGSKVLAFLKVALKGSDTEEFLKLSHYDPWTVHALRLGHLQGIAAREDAKLLADASRSQTSTASTSQMTSNSRKVFIVHGHDSETKFMVARFLEKIRLEPIILHEQPNEGRTIIEKFETYSGDTAFAVILLTDDDVGGTKGGKEPQKLRARQNVILELGYFMGRLGRTRVCALHKGGVELPSDYQGVLYVVIDTEGAWKLRLAQELVQAKLPIDLAGLPGS
jgi:predicted nucleotide-binding protein